MMSREIRDVLEQAAGERGAGFGFPEVWNRGRKLRARKIVLQSASVLTLVAGLAAVIVAWDPLVTNEPLQSVGKPTESPQYSPSPEASTSAKPSVAGRLVPEARLNGNETTLQVVFPDGVRREFVYPSGLDLESLGVRPYVTINGGDACFGGVVARYDDDQWYRSDGEPLAEYPTSDGATAAVWNVTDVPVSGHYLVFNFGHWTVGIPESEFCDLVGDHGRMLAGSLDGMETQEGFLVLIPSAPTSFARSIGPEGPSLTFGAGPNLEIFFQDCEPYEAETTIEGRLVNQYQDYSDWCIPEAGIRMQMSGSKEEVERFIRGISVGA